MEQHCSTCREAITGIEQIACKGVCSKRFHIACTGLSKSLARQIDTTSNNVFWFCDDCAAIISNPSFRSMAFNASAETNAIAQLTNAITELRSDIKQLAPKPIRTPLWNKSTPTSTPIELRRPMKRIRVPDAVSTEPCQLGSRNASNDLVSVPLCDDENPKLLWIYLSRIKPDVTEDAVKAMVHANLGVEDANDCISGNSWITARSSFAVLNNNSNQPSENLILIPGRIIHANSEVLYSGHQRPTVPAASRPVNRSGGSEGGFQLPCYGKYTSVSKFSPSDAFMPSSFTCALDCAFFIPNDARFGADASLILQPTANSCSDIDANSAFFNWNSGRTTQSNWEVLYPDHQRLTVPASSHPVYRSGGSGGGFQLPFNGKYPSVLCIPSSHTPLPSSPEPCASSSTVPFDKWDVCPNGNFAENLLIGSPGCNELSTMEAPKPFVTVAHSRPIDHRKTRPIDASNLSDALRLYYQNVRGLKSKICECFVATSELGYEIYSFTETWLDSSVPSSQLFGSDYNVFRCDRSSVNSRRSRGGGVLRGCSLITSFLIGTAYIPPEKSQDGSIIDQHVDGLSEVRLQHPSCSVILLGDFNQPQLTWIRGDSNSMVIDSTSVLTSASASLLDGMQLNGMDQRNSLRNSQNRTLDLVFTDDSISISSVTEAIDAVVPIDTYHPPFNFDISFPNPIVFDEAFDTSARNFNRADFDTMNRVLSEINWTDFLNCTDVDIAVRVFSSILDDVFNNSVPLVRPPLRPPWSNGRLKRLKQLRSKLLRKFTSSRCPFTKMKLNIATRKYRSFNRFCYRRYVARTQRELRRNPKKFWKFVNSKRKESGLPAVLQLNDRIATSSAEKCNLFAMHFSSVFSDLSPTADQIFAAVTRLPIDVLNLDVFSISEEMVLEAIGKLKYTTSAGQDGIPACVLKKCRTLLVKPLTHIFNRSLEQQKFPDLWKRSFMSPVYKKGDKQNILNYRGVTSLAACSKVLERIVNDVIFSACRNWISENQHGFFPKRSVTTNLTVFTSYCISQMDGGKQIDAIYTDISAAFDSVNHDILLKKLQRLGCSERLCAWIKSYLTNRRLAVRIGSAESPDFIPKSGVPQGSNLGPLLFTMFCNDINLLLIGCGVLLYADDLKIFLVINSLADCYELQGFLDMVVNWCADNLLVLSVA
ncbi:uncharacterized protein LOC129741736 [Uranotaenia lowii]|uniref:uncharacterized protein LOC129741736 n=1 Tax=Uranotaenia lowii TaxID=190385 RepID=UPI00247858BC|nr:uncharacterized protein LOC129741736 [Uranotaenia lowii]